MIYGIFFAFFVNMPTTVERNNMSSVRGLALMSRLEYFERIYGSDKYRDFLKKISSDEVNFFRQPVDYANTYSDKILAAIDQILLEDYFEGDINKFREVGLWSADNFIYRYFSQYVDNASPPDFLLQYSRLRDHLIGSGQMIVEPVNDNLIKVNIDYGQVIPKSVCLSEQGFLQGGMEQCGASKIKIEELGCASDSETFICSFEIKYK